MSPLGIDEIVLRILHSYDNIVILDATKKIIPKKLMNSLKD